VQGQFASVRIGHQPRSETCDSLCPVHRCHLCIRNSFRNRPPTFSATCGEATRLPPGGQPSRSDPAWCV